MDVDDLGFLGPGDGARTGARSPAPSAGDPAPGGGRPPGRLVRWLAVGVVAVLIGAVLLGRTGRHPPENPPRPGPSGPPSAGIPGSVPYVALQSLCPVRAGGRGRLDLSFVVVNLATVDLRIDQVRLWLPPKGLLTRAPATSGGSCRAPGAASASAVLGPNAHRLFTLHLVLPQHCSAPVPVLAEFQFEAYGQQAVSELALYDDLTRIYATACPVAGAADPRNRIGAPPSPSPPGT